MNREHTRLDSHGAVATLTLARPDIRNALTGSGMLDEILATIRTLPTAGTRILILTGEGSAFSAGGNVKEMAERAGIFGGRPLEIAGAYRDSIQQLTRAMATTDLVTIAAVNGPAVGAGFDLVLGADLAIGSELAWFAHTFVDLGIIPGDGGAWLLPRVVGWQRATELALTARRVGAEEARDLGILLEVTGPDNLMSRVSELADLIGAKPAHSVRLAKLLLRHARSMDLDGFLELSAALQALSHSEPDHVAALEAYMEKLSQT